MKWEGGLTVDIRCGRPWRGIEAGAQHGTRTWVHAGQALQVEPFSDDMRSPSHLSHC